MIFYKFVKNSVIFASKIFFNVNYYGIENIPQNQGCIICCNHRSNWDPILISKPIKKYLYFMAKEELFKYKFLGNFLKKLGAFPVARGKKDASAITTSINLINNNNFIVIFPEGTRSKNGDFLKPKAGAALIAYKAHADILPIKIIYHEPIKFRSKIDVIYGKVIPANKLNITENSLQQIRDASKFIMDNIKNLTPTK